MPGIEKRFVEKIIFFHSTIMEKTELEQIGASLVSKHSVEALNLASVHRAISMLIDINLSNRPRIAHNMAETFDMAMIALMDQLHVSTGEFAAAYADLGRAGETCSLLMKLDQTAGNSTSG